MIKRRDLWFLQFVTAVDWFWFVDLKTWILRWSRNQEQLRLQKDCCWRRKHLKKLCWIIATIDCFHSSLRESLANSMAAKLSSDFENPAKTFFSQLGECLLLEQVSFRVIKYVSRTRSNRWWKSHKLYKHCQPSRYCTCLGIIKKAVKPDEDRFRQTPSFEQQI